jgi:flavin-dependent dehydrogenase
MKYDLIIVGGGPGGLMAAKTAAEDGLKVVLIERKRNITEINRACSQIFYVRKLTVMADDKSDTGEMHRDGYIEPVSVEYDDKTTRFHFPAPGFSLDYDGCLRPYLNWIYISPSGHSINQYHWNDRPWGFYFHKETFLVGLLASVKKAKAEVLSETIGLGAENTKYGVKVRVRSKSSEQTLEAKAAIAADGVSSSIVESLGLNKKRQILWKGSERAGFVHYIVEGIETGFPDSSWLSWAIPSINPGGSVMIGLSADNSYTVGAATTNAVAVIEKFMSDPRYAHMFRQARIMKREVVPFTGIVRVPLSEPVAGNVVVIGDAAAPIETWTQGAVACGYQAVKAIEKELNGQKGYPDYIDWWQQAFAFNNPEYSRTLSVLYLLHGICSDEDIDYIYSLFQGRVGIPAMLVARNMDLIKKGRPEIYNKLANR